MALDTTVGGASADSYGTLAAYQAYAAARGWTLIGVDATDEANLRRAADFIDRRHRFIGERQYQTQARSWPRLVNVLVKDWPVDPDTIPSDIESAQFEVAYLLQGGLDPFATITESRKRATVGPITVETVPTGRPQVVAAQGLLAPYLIAGAGQIALMR